MKNKIVFFFLCVSKMEKHPQIDYGQDYGIYSVLDSEHQFLISYVYF